MTRHIPLLFWWQTVRDLRRHPLLALLNVLSIALGLTVYLAIQISNGSANRAFAATVDLVAGKAHLEVRGSVNETLWPKLEANPEVAAVTGIVESTVTLPDFPGEYLRIFGIDSFTSASFLTFQLSQRREDFDIEEWLGRPDGIALTAEIAQRLGLHRGDSFRVLVNGQIRSLTVTSLLDTRESPNAVEPRFAAMDIGWAQELFGKQGRLSALLILLRDPTRGEAVAAELDKLLPPDLHAQPPRQRSSQLQRMVSAFQLNLTALSMVSLLVGVFLVYNTVSASVTRRRREIGILRAMGATQNEVRALFLGEACVFGFFGIVLGCVAGFLLAPLLAGAVGKTISSLYVLVSIGKISASPAQFALAACFGIAAVLTGAWMPANDAARTDPVNALSLGAHGEQSIGRVRVWAWLGLGAVVLGGIAALAARTAAPPEFSFAAAFFVLIAWALLSPISVRLAGRAATAIASPAAILWRLASDRFARSVHRNAVTVASLATAIAMMTGLTVMIMSFRQTVVAWINSGVVADLLIAPASNEVIGLSATIPQQVVEWLRAQPDIASVDTFREQRIRASAHGGEAQSALLAVTGGVYRNNMQFADGDAARKGAQIFNGSAIAVSEPFARHWRVKEGDTLSLQTPTGLVSMPIAGVYSDYFRDEGVILIARTAFDRYWNEPDVQSLAVYVRNSEDTGAVAEAFRKTWNRSGEFNVYSNRSLRERVLSIFDQTFAITTLLRIIAVIVAVIGIFLSITTLVVERERETGTLRAIGASRGQIMRLTMQEAALMGAVAALLGIGAGCMLAVVLTDVVNPAFFGWSIRLHWPWLALVTTPLWIVLTAILAAWLPARRASLVNISQAVREE
ncbi:ABC transporter permease [Verrucomicrobiota bacterium sgz303538]